MVQKPRYIIRNTLKHLGRLSPEQKGVGGGVWWLTSYSKAKLQQIHLKCPWLSPQPCSHCGPRVHRVGDLDAPPGAGRPSGCQPQHRAFKVPQGTKFPWNQGKREQRPFQAWKRGTHITSTPIPWPPSHAHV